MKTLTTLVVAAAFITCTTTAARAADSLDQRSVTVSYSDLNTASSAGVASLFERLKGASQSVCRDLEPGRDLSKMAEYANCKNTAITNAIRAVNLSTLSEYAAAKGVPTGSPTIRVAGIK